MFKLNLHQMLLRIPCRSIALFTQQLTLLILLKFSLSSKPHLSSPLFLYLPILEQLLLMLRPVEQLHYYFPSLHLSVAPQLLPSTCYHLWLEPHYLFVCLYHHLAHQSASILAYQEVYTLVFWLRQDLSH